MSDRFLIEYDRRAVGVAVRVPGGFRFFASDPAFSRIEGKIFARVRLLIAQVNRTGRAVERRPRPGLGLSAAAG